jgi:diguanylate cyclase (GGDEF)-like protein
MEESLEQELLRARRTTRTVALLLVDLDRFKSVNDTHGHDAGDELLRAVSQEFQTRMRAGDVVCRYGGEEFLFVLPEISLAHARSRAEELRTAVRGLVVKYRGGALDTVTISSGIAVFPEHGETVATLLQTADAALYRAKARGGDCVEVANGRQPRVRSRRIERERIVEGAATEPERTEASAPR